MEIREATEADIPAIVALLKESLGESLMPKSEQYWRWKHIQNPFGASPVIVAAKGNDIIGVRAFMRWEWQSRNASCKALRAVDTATHPKHQGAGIFKKLTLSLLHTCTERGDHFIFNTPNESSKPGYLKMGWKEAGKLPVRVGIRSPFNMIRTALTQKLPSGDQDGSRELSHYLNHLGLNKLLQQCECADSLVTKVTSDYLKWRYLDVPVTKYVCVGHANESEMHGLIIGRIKAGKFGRELRITDCFFRHNEHDVELLQLLKMRIKEWGVDYVTLSGTMPKNKIIPSGFLNLRIGPIVTVRNLSGDHLNLLDNFKKWSPSLGDLELF